ncbi:hypothetical protein [Halorussus aquaticus]|uniref:Uncharacterized protein n=1 Tax=Halorussus aquaticus TaxID=2953748 RepID=A0ABD5Q6F7_9EURY|nr:hypothetical protein [Halorussus aquaticus]
MALPIPGLVAVSESLTVVATAVFVPFALASLVYLDARWRRSSAGSRDRALAPLAWGATTFLSGVACPLVAACYVAVRGR